MPWAPGKVLRWGADTLVVNGQVYRSLWVLDARPIITGDYTGFPSWGRHPIAVGTPVGKPTPVFTKLDPSVIEAELARLG